MIDFYTTMLPTRIATLTPSKPPSHNVLPSYRPDVDGLRAVAVLAVVIFHAFPSALSGGFVGVDVFFVISGYLISTIIYTNLEHNNFSFGDFYFRRVRRIFPALILVLSACLIAGWQLLFADEYRQLGKHTFKGSVFLSNFTLWREAGYFDNASDTKPLLHLWSLGIEEQFYIIWPFVLWFGWKNKWNLLRVTITIAAISFAINIITSKHGTAAPFFLPPTRFWELLIGATLAYILTHENKPNIPARYVQLSSFAGILLLLSGFIFISRDNVFPKFWALMPVFGAALLIISGPNAWVNRHILSNRIFIWFGVISYPLYLWHWPLLSFLRIYFGDQTSSLYRTIAVLVSVALAWATYRVVEAPIRFRGATNKNAWILVALMAGIGTSGWIISKMKGIESRPIGQLGKPFQFNLEDKGYKPCKVSNILDDDIGNCLIASEPLNAGLIGDSHAADKFPGIVNEIPSQNWVLLGNNSCAPVLGVEVITNEKQCLKKFEKIYRYLEENSRIKTVLISFSLAYAMSSPVAADHINLQTSNNNQLIMKSSVFKGDDQSLFAQGLELAVKDMLDHQKDVVLLLDVPELPFFPKDCVRQNKVCSISREDVLERQAPHRAMIAAIQARHPTVRTFDPIDIFCDKNSCGIYSGSVLMYRDSHHMSTEGSNIYGRALHDWMKNNGLQI